MNNIIAEWQLGLLITRVACRKIKCRTEENNKMILIARRLTRNLAEHYESTMLCDMTVVSRQQSRMNY